MARVDHKSLFDHVVKCTSVSEPGDVKDVMFIKEVVLYVRLGFLAPTFQGISFGRRYYRGKFMEKKQSPRKADQSNPKLGRSGRHTSLILWPRLLRPRARTRLHSHRN